MCDEQQKRYLLVATGFEGYKRVHETLFDLEVRDETIWIHAVNVDRPLEEELIEEGAKPQEIAVASAQTALSVA